MSCRYVEWRGLAVLVAVTVLGVLVAGAAQAQPIMNCLTETLLSVHPNERGAGYGSGAILIGTAPWTTSGLAGPYYTFKQYKFYDPGPWGYEEDYCVKVKVNAQNYANNQNPQGTDDRLWMKIDGVTPTDAYGIQSGPAGQYQWKGGADGGHRKTLYFNYNGGLGQGEHTIKFQAKNTPIIWWVEVTAFRCCACGPPL